MKSIKYLYITDQLLHTVKDSQVINWLEVLQENGITFDLIVTTPLPYLLKNNRLRKKKIQRAKSKLKGNVYQVITLKNSDYLGINTLIKSVYIFFYLIKPYLSGNKLIIQTRSLDNYWTLKVLKALFPSIRLIYDYRGAIAEEYINSTGITDVQTASPEIRHRYYRLLRKQLNLIRFSDKTFCVSNALKQYTLKHLAEMKPDKIQVVPGGADDKKFKVDTVIRNKMRDELYLQNKFIMIYTGKLGSFWHKKDLVFESAARFTHENQNHHFICITSDIGDANKLASTYKLIPSQILIKYLDNDEIPAYLNSADLAILLRDDIPTNNVASPTKLPEYLLCGLPVIVSKGVGDYSSFIAENDLGIVVDNNIRKIEDAYRRIKSSTINNSRISNIARQKYAKQALIDDLLKMYNELELT